MALIIIYVNLESEIQFRKLKTERKIEIKKKAQELIYKELKKG